MEKSKNRIWKGIRRVWFACFKYYERLELKVFTYEDANVLIRENIGKPEEQQWIIAREEDDNIGHVGFVGFVWLERRKRITE